MSGRLSVTAVNNVKNMLNSETIQCVPVSEWVFSQEKKNFKVFVPSVILHESFILDFEETNIKARKW